MTRCLTFGCENIEEVGCEGNGAGVAVFGVAEGGVGGMEIGPFEVEDFAAAGAGGEGEETMG